MTVVPPNFDASLSYSTTDVFLNLTAQLGQSTNLNVNQQNVANALNSFFNTGSALPPELASVLGLTGAGLGNALSELDGEVATSAEHCAFPLTNEFLDLMLDPFVNGRSNFGDAGGGASGLGFAPDQQAT